MSKTNNYRQKVLIGNWVEEQFALNHIHKQAQEKHTNLTLNMQHVDHQKENKFLSNQDFENQLDDLTLQGKSKLETRVSISQNEQLTRTITNPLSGSKQQKCKM